MVCCIVSKYRTARAAIPFGATSAGTSVTAGIVVFSGCILGGNFRYISCGGVDRICRCLAGLEHWIPLWCSSLRTWLIMPSLVVHIGRITNRAGACLWSTATSTTIRTNIMMDNSGSRRRVHRLGRRRRRIICGLLASGRIGLTII